MNFLKLNQNNINPIQFLYTASKSLEVKPLLNKQTCEDLSAYNPPMTPATIRDQSSKYQLQHLVKNLEDENSTLEKSNQKLFNVFIKNIKTNCKLMKSVNDNLDLIKSSIEFIESTKQNKKGYEEIITERSNELSIKITQMKALQSLNDKYTNENKVLKNKIKKIREKVRKANDKCDDLHCFNKE